MLFGSAYGWWLSEQYNANPAGENTDGNVFGAQVGLKFALFGGETRVAAHYYDCGACQDQTSILFGNSGNGNTTYPVGHDHLGNQRPRRVRRLHQHAATSGTTTTSRAVAARWA